MVSSKCRTQARPAKRVDLADRDKNTPPINSQDWRRTHINEPLLTVVLKLLLVSRELEVVVVRARESGESAEFACAGSTSAGFIVDTATRHNLVFLLIR